jgi:hypothetical protein
MRRHHPTRLTDHHQLILSAPIHSRLPVRLPFLRRPFLRVLSHSIPFRPTGPGHPLTWDEENECGWASLGAGYFELRCPAWSWVWNPPRRSESQRPPALAGLHKNRFPRISSSRHIHRILYLDYVATRSSESQIIRKKRDIYPCYQLLQGALESSLKPGDIFFLLMISTSARTHVWGLSS